MDLPDEDNAALAKRRAIQALMKDKTLTPAERNVRMQAIIKGDFTDPGPPAAAAAASSAKLKSKLSASLESFGSSEDDDDDSSSESSSEEEDSHQGSTRTGRSGKSSASGRGKAKTSNSKSTASRSIGSGSGGTGSGTNYSRGNNSKVDPRNETSEHSTISSTTLGMEGGEIKQVELQKERQKKLLEIHRNSNLSRSQKALAMKSAMKTDVKQEVAKRPKRHVKKMGSINESITIPKGFDESSLLSVKHRSTRRLSADSEQIQKLIQQLANDDPSLTELVLEKKGLGDEEVIPLFDVFGGNTHVTIMNMRINRIGNEGCSALASAILDNDSLTLIDLSGNNIGDEGVEDLCKVIPYNTSLTQLNMADNKLGDLSASELAGSLVDNSSLVHINLSGNFIGDEGAMNLFKVLATINQTLQSLLLRLNGVTDVGASALAAALIENETLLSIDLGHNLIGNKGGMDLLKVLSCNETIEEMKLDGNKNIDQEILDEIDQELCCDSSSEEDSGSEEGSEDGSEYSSEDVSRDGKLEDTAMNDKSSSEFESESESDSEVEELDRRQSLLIAEADIETDESEEEEENEKDHDSAPTGGEAMLTDMPDEDNLALAKRKAVQAVMQDKSLSAIERNKKIQDIMAGKVELPKVSVAKKPAVAAVEPEAPAAKEKSAEENEKDHDSAPTGGEAMLTDMPDEDNLALAKRKAVQAVMQDKSLSAIERNKKIQDIMAGKVELPKVSVAKKPAAAVEPEAAPLKSPKTKAKKQVKSETKTAAAAAVVKKPTKAKPTSNDPFEMSDISLNPGHQFQHKDSTMSYDFGTPTAIAQDWKQWMMTTHPKAIDNPLDVLLAHKYRLSLRFAPNQSSFRVVAVVFFSRNQREERFHVVGTNDEPHSVSGSICAERAALMQLRFVLDLEEITKIIITTDDVDPISPGMLCREFMSSFKQMSDSTPIILGRSVCRKCGLNLSGKACGEKGEFVPDNMKDVHEKIFEECCTKKDSKYPSPHDFVGSTTSLRELFPYPSLYSGLSSVDAFKFGQTYAASKPNHNPNEGTGHILTNSIKSTRTIDSTVGSYRQERFDLSMISATSEDDPITPAAKTPNRKIPDPPSGSFTSSLKTSVDFMRRIREDGDDDQDESGLHEMTPAIVQHLTSKSLKVSSRLKQSQRRDKLIRLATEATAMEIPHRRIHPIRYGAAVLFSDNTVALASQNIALEYGCTLDAIGQLASAINKKYLQADADRPVIKPVLIVQCDQFGIAHAPFAQGRSFLTERGFGDCKVLIHQRRDGKKSGDAESDDSQADLRLVEVLASELAPSPPDIFGTIIPKNHAQGLQIEF